MARNKSNSTRIHQGAITVTVTDSGGAGGLVSGARISLHRAPPSSGKATFDASKWHDNAANWLANEHTDDEGQVTFNDLDAGVYVVRYEHYPRTHPQCVEVGQGCHESTCFHLDLAAKGALTYMNPDCQPIACPQPHVNDRVVLTVSFNGSDALKDHARLQLPRGMARMPGNPLAGSMALRRIGAQDLDWALLLDPLSGPAEESADRMIDTALVPARLLGREPMFVEARVPNPIAGSLSVALSRSETAPTDDIELWGAIRASTETVSFNRYERFMDQLFCGNQTSSTHKTKTEAYDRLLKRRFLPFTDTDAYRVLKVATEAFVMVNCSVLTGDQDDTGASDVLADLNDYLGRRDLPALDSRDRYSDSVDGINLLPYLAIIRRKLPDVPINPRVNRNSGEADLCDGFIQEKLSNPCLIELIWSYWQEEGMLVQTMNAVTRRFQNLRGLREPDPLANVEVNPLRPLNNLLWGYVQDEQHRLTVARRNAEYDHHYGLRLEGRAVTGFRGADSRSRFIEAFHHLLRLCTVFYKQDDNTTVKADAFSVLNALKEVHLILSQGAHSQFGDLPATARIEMLMQQWMISRPEFREFLPTRVMVAYPEPWMDRVDAMKRLQGWTDTSVLHFHNLAVFGEQILLAIRYGAWSTVVEPTQAFNFARFFRPQVQGYVHAYRAATGAELGAETVDTRVDSTLPSVLLQRRLAAQPRST